MLRSMVHVFAALCLLLQAATGFAQGQHLSPHEPVSSKAAAEAAMPCHMKADEAKASKTSAAKDCCKTGDCKCAHACAASALPSAPAELDDFISAHFDALRSQVEFESAQAKTPQRPPAPRS